MIMRAITLIAAITIFIASSPVVAIAASDAQAASSVPAFPGAEGFGANAVGGRGGQVIEVTNLNDSGPGSLRTALKATGPRTIVFRVAGTIVLKSPLAITQPFVTIAGQTAPGGGIALRNDGVQNKGSSLKIKTHDVVIRYLRVRPGPGGESDAIAIESDTGNEAYNIILDHISASWGVDEVLSLATDWDNPNSFRTHDVTIQWSIIAEGLECSTHSQGCHSKGLMVGGKTSNVSLHHNLIAHNKERSPLLHARDVVDVVNNVIYTSGLDRADIAVVSDRLDPGDRQFYNIVGNSFVRTADAPISAYEIGRSTRPGDVPTDIKLYVNGNTGPHRLDQTLQQDQVVHPDDRSYVITTQHAAPAVTTTSAEAAYEEVLAKAGAVLPQRDAVDNRIVNQVRSRTGGLIDDPSQVGGWPDLASGTPPTDTDHDGMPDDWEIQHSLDPNNAADGLQDANQNGYTNLEEYLNEIPALGYQASPEQQLLFLPLTNNEP
jgi:pectate lyase